MKLRDLRLGNLVFYNARTPSEIELHHFCHMSEGLFLKQYSPIPLTGEWLLKFGFTKIDESYFSIKISEYSELNYDFEDNSVRHDSHWISELKYVHQLQNLYKALTGEELEVNEIVLG